MGLGNIDNGAAASIPIWRANAPKAGPWRQVSVDFDSGYESGSSEAKSPPPYAGGRSSSWGCDHCREYDSTYGSYKEQERRVRKWLCDKYGSPRPESDLDNIDVGTLVRMASRLNGLLMPFTVKQSLLRAIKGRKRCLEWHWDGGDHQCGTCGRLWTKADLGHKHHIEELERILEILEGGVKPTIDPRALKSWRN